jgi:hypothetical protein
MILSNPIKSKGMQNNLLYPQFSKQPKKPKIERKKKKKEDSVVTL